MAYWHRLPWREWPNRAQILGATISLTALVVFALIRVYDQAEDHRRVAAQMVWFRHSAAELRAVQWQLLAEPDFRQLGFDRFRLARVGFLRARIALVEAPEPAPPDGFEEGYRAYATAVDRIIRLSLLDTSRRAYPEAAEAERAYASLVSQVTVAEDAALAAEARYLRAIRAAAFGVIFLGAIGAVGVTFRAFGSIERREARFRLLSEQSSDLHWVLDAEGDVLYANAFVRRTLPSDPDDTTAFWAAVTPDDRERVRSFLGYLAHRQNTVHTLEAEFVGGDGHVHCLDIIGRNLTDDPHVGGLALTARDITHRKHEEESRRRQVLRDALTGLPNRALLADRIAAALAAGAHDPHLLFAVIFIDLDGFRAINDTLGHSVGDTLLVAVADRLSKALRILGRENDPTRPDGTPRKPGADTLARVGGDEFVVLLNYAQSPKNALGAANRLLAELSHPFMVAGRDIQVSASLGVTTGPGSYHTVDELLRDADVAMYRAKAAGRSQARLFDPAMQQQASQALSLKAHFRSALERGALMVHYQPIVTLKAHELRGCEALVRWTHEGRPVPPSEFIPVAEETGLIIPMGRFVLKESCRQAAAWRQEFPEHPLGLVHVNVSAAELVHPDFIATVDDILRDTGVLQGDIIFELTESMAMQDPERTIAIIADLQARGHKVAIDDFGTGYCSLSYLHRLAINVLKIDRSFIEDIETSPRALAAVKLVVEMARSMEIEVVAEGVETGGQAALLREIGCGLGQGYGFSRPTPAFQLRPRFLAQQAAMRVAITGLAKTRPVTGLAAATGGHESH